jgi:hypothetical protein
MRSRDDRPNTHPTHPSPRLPAEGPGFLPLALIHQFVPTICAPRGEEKSSPAEHKLRCLKGIAQTKELNPARSFQLANIVDTYIQMDAAEEEKYRR